MAGRKRCRCRPSRYSSSGFELAEDHRVANIRYKELVETQHPGFARDGGRHLVDGVLHGAEQFQARMHVLHHAMKVNAFLPVAREALEEQVHEKGLAAADAAPYVEASYMFARCAAKQQGAKRSRSLRGDPRLQVLEAGDKLELRRVFDMTFALEAVLVGLAYIQTTLFVVFIVPAMHGKITWLIT